jgi:hypothetical protein
VDDEALFAAAMLRLAEDETERRRLATASPEIMRRLSEDAIHPFWAQVLGHKR